MIAPMYFAKKAGFVLLGLLVIIIVFISIFSRLSQPKTIEQLKGLNNWVKVIKYYDSGNKRDLDIFKLKVLDSIVEYFTGNNVRYISKKGGKIVNRLELYLYNKELDESILNLAYTRDSRYAYLDYSTEAGRISISIELDDLKYQNFIEAIFALTD